VGNFGAVLGNNWNRPCPYSTIPVMDIVAIARRFYPSLGDPDDYSPREWDAAFSSAKETLTLREQQASASADGPRSQWRGFLDELRQKLGDSYRVSDQTHLHRDACYSAVVVMPTTTIAFHASILVPCYWVYEAGEPFRDVPLSPPVDIILATIDRLMVDVLERTRIAGELAREAIDEIYIPHLLPGQAKVANALFTSVTW